MNKTESVKFFISWFRFCKRSHVCLYCICFVLHEYIYTLNASLFIWYLIIKVSILQCMELTFTVLKTWKVL